MKSIDLTAWMWSFLLADLELMQCLLVSSRLPTQQEGKVHTSQGYAARSSYHTSAGQWLLVSHSWSSWAFWQLHRTVVQQSKKKKKTEMALKIKCINKISRELPCQHKRINQLTYTNGNVLILGFVSYISKDLDFILIDATDRACCLCLQRHV